MSFQVNKGPKNLEALSRSRALPGGRELAVQERAGITGEQAQENAPGNAAGNAAESQPEAASAPQEGAAMPDDRTALDILLEQAGVIPEEGEIPQMDPGLELGTGFLAVNVTSGGGLLPIEGAVVTITTQQTLGQLVWARAITNSSGQILPVALPAPPRLFSQYPETPQQLAFGRYNVYVQARGMIPNLRQNVEIFDGVTSIQNIDLTPNAAGMTEESLNRSADGQNEKP